MSSLNSLLERVQRAYAKVAEVENIAARFPGDRSILANLRSLQRSVDALELDWQREALIAQKEVCRYRIIPQGKTDFPIRQVSMSLLNFQDLFSQIYDAMEGRIKSRAQIAPSIATETSFNFAFSYPGSLGVAMTVDSQSTLFGGKYDEAVDALISMISMRDETEVRATAEKFGLSVIKRIFDWSNTNLMADYAISTEWTNSLGRKKGGLASVEDFNRIVSIIGRVSDTEREHISVVGILLGIDTFENSTKFRFIKLNGEIYSGSLANDFPAGQKWSVNTQYTADIDVESVTAYATEETKRIYRLTNLK